MDNIDIFLNIKNYLANHYELVALCTNLFFIFFLYGIFKEHNWVYNNRIAIKTGINELPLKAQNLQRWDYIWEILIFKSTEK